MSHYCLECLCLLTTVAIGRLPIYVEGEQSWIRISRYIVWHWLRHLFLHYRLRVLVEDVKRQFLWQLYEMLPLYVSVRTAWFLAVRTRLQTWYVWINPVFIMGYPGVYSRRTRRTTIRRSERGNSSYIPGTRRATLTYKWSTTVTLNNS